MTLYYKKIRKFLFFKFYSHLIKTEIVENHEYVIEVFCEGSFSFTEVLEKNKILIIEII